MSGQLDNKRMFWDVLITWAFGCLVYACGWTSGRLMAWRAARRSAVLAEQSVESMAVHLDRSGRLFKQSMHDLGVLIQAARDRQDWDMYRLGIDQAILVTSEMTHKSSAEIAAELGVPLKLYDRVVAESIMSRGTNDD